VTREEQLGWEVRWGRPVAAAALVAAVLCFVSRFVFSFGGRDGIEPLPDKLLSIDEAPAGYLAFVCLPAVAAILTVPLFYYLFRAARARGDAMPDWFVYIVLLGPVLFAAALVVGAVNDIDLADRFAAQDTVRGEAGVDQAEDMTDTSPLVLGLQSAGIISLAFLYVMIPLRARRVGLLSPFMGIMGVLTAALVVFSTLGIAPIIQAFWLGAIGLLLLGRWPGGRGPAWESGEAEPWPSAAQRRGREPMPGEEPQLDPDAPLPEPEPVPERPASRKRRKKR